MRTFVMDTEMPFLEQWSLVMSFTAIISNENHISLEH